MLVIAFSAVMSFAVAFRNCQFEISWILYQKFHSESIKCNHKSTTDKSKKIIHKTKQTKNEKAKIS